MIKRKRKGDIQVGDKVRTLYTGYKERPKGKDHRWHAYDAGTVCEVTHILDHGYNLSGISGTSGLEVGQTLNRDQFELVTDKPERPADRADRPAEMHDAGDRIIM